MNCAKPDAFLFDFFLADKICMDTCIQTKVLVEAVTLLINYKVANHLHLLEVEEDRPLQARNPKPYNPVINIRIQQTQTNLHV